MARKASREKRIEERTQQIGRELFDRLNRRAPSVFHPLWWEDRLLDWAMRDSGVRLQMYRFLDVLPMLRNHQAIARHLDEYFDDVRGRLPTAARLGLELSNSNSVLSRALAWNARTNADRIARRFVAGETPADVLEVLQRLRSKRLAFSLHRVGDAVLSDVEADACQQDCLDMLHGLATQVNDWPSDPLTDDDPDGPIPRIQLSVDPANLAGSFALVDSAGTTERILERLRPVLAAARECEASVTLTPARHRHQALTQSLLRTVLMESEFRDWDGCGIALTAAFTDSERELKDLLAWIKKRGTPIAVRLACSARQEHEIRQSSQCGWPVPVSRSPWQAERNFEQAMRKVLENRKWLRPVVAARDLRSFAWAAACVEVLGLPEQAIEFLMPYGVADRHAQLLTEQDFRVRIDAPFGSRIPGLACQVRRLLENPSDDWLLRRHLEAHHSIEVLLMSPAARARSADGDVSAAETDEPVFQNEPLTDFAIAENREQMQQALDEVRDAFGAEYPLIIDGKACDSRSSLVSRNPSRSSEIVGRVASATADQAQDAVEAARRAFPGWAATDVATRVEYLELIAAEMRQRRFELAAWIVFECGKPWEAADAEVAEAIDFCMYYSLQMQQLDVPQRSDIPGEENRCEYRPCGVTAILTPWNSPLAAPVGMTTAALVTGNTVVLKPAQQASVVAAQMMEILRNAHVPDGVVNFLPGVGADSGTVLSTSPLVDLVAFAGSTPVGLEVNQSAAVTADHQSGVRRVMASLGGNNAIIVDDDADLDEAVTGVIRSAFDFAGQHCASCSRVIVLDSCGDQFVDRLVEAARSLTVGPADEPGTQVGPVIDAESRDRILQAVHSLDPEVDGTVVLAGDVSDLSDAGNFIGLQIVTDVSSSSRLLQEELLGPIVFVIRVRNLDEAFDVANATRYALTGGLYSRSPASLKRARREFHVGNLCLNRPINAPRVHRHPFGGFRMSGTGIKAGGPDYLRHFLIPVSISEDTSRTGL